jgi:dTDP-glucose 4,6-dehydratase
MKFVVAGGAGFIGSNFVRLMLDEHQHYQVIVLDKLTYAGNLGNLKAVHKDPRFRFVQMDICQPEVGQVLEGADAVINFAAESHVDRSIEDASVFVRTNVEGTFRLLEACRRKRVPRYVQVSTDEVYGSLAPREKFHETTPLAPRSPYAATKASADLLVLAAAQTHGTPAIITRCSNNYGPYQFPEKFIPLMIAQALAGEPLPVYGDGTNVRDWIHVQDHCRALDAVVHRGRDGDVYNIGGECEMENVEVATRILDLVGRGRDLIRFVADRPGHDRRYAIDCEKLKSELGWRQQWSFEAGLADTVRWYCENYQWLDEVRSGAYRDYFARHYRDRERTLAESRHLSKPSILPTAV